MNKELDALKTLVSHRKCGGIEFQWEREECRKTIEKALKALEVIKAKGISFVIPNNELSNEHITIEIYTKTLTSEELSLLKEVLGL